MKTRDVNLTDEKRKLHSPAALGEALHRKVIDRFVDKPAFQLSM